MSSPPSDWIHARSQEEVLCSIPHRRHSENQLIIITYIYLMLSVINPVLIFKKNINKNKSRMETKHKTLTERNSQQECTVQQKSTTDSASISTRFFSTPCPSHKTEQRLIQSFTDYALHVWRYFTHTAHLDRVKSRAFHLISSSPLAVFSLFHLLFSSATIFTQLLL